MSILSHINKRVKADGSLRLPLAPLSTLFRNSATPPVVANFALVYLEMGLPRADASERASLVAGLLVGVGSRPPPQQDTLLGMLLPCLKGLPLPQSRAAMDEPGGATALGTPRALLASRASLAPSPRLLTPSLAFSHLLSPSRRSPRLPRCRDRPQSRAELAARPSALPAAARLRAAHAAAGPLAPRRQARLRQARRRRGVKTARNHTFCRHAASSAEV